MYWIRYDLERIVSMWEQSSLTTSGFLINAEENNDYAFLAGRNTQANYAFAC